MAQIVGKDSVNVGEFQGRVALHNSLRGCAVLKRSHHYFQQNTGTTDAQSAACIFIKWRRFSLNIESHSVILQFEWALVERLPTFGLLVLSCLPTSTESIALLMRLLNSPHYRACGFIKTTRITDRCDKNNVFFGRVGLDMHS